MMFRIAYTPFSWLLNASSQIDGLFPFLLALFGVSLWCVWKSRKPMAPLPPGPRGLPIVGYLPFLGSDNLHLVFTDLARVYGSIYKLWLGNKLTIVISSPSLVKQVVRDHDVPFSERDPPIAAKIATYGGNNITFDSYSSPSYKNKRKVLAYDMLSNANLNASYGLRREQVMKTIGDVYKNVGKPIDIGELAFLTTINATISMILGGDFRGEEGATNTLEGHFKDLSTELMVLIGKPNISDIFPVIARFDIQGIERRITKVHQSFNEILDSIFELRMKAKKEKVDATSEQKLDFLQVLLDLHNKKKDDTSSLTMNQVKGILTDLVVGGTDTTSTATEWAMAELTQHPEIMDKLKKELADVVGINNTVEEFHLPSLSYLNAVIKETYRLHPPLPLLVPRCAGKSVTVGGYNIPKGTGVFLNAWSIHMDPSIWENPSEFKPERFLNEVEKFDFLGNDFRYMPFGSGRRTCPGIHLGEKMLSFLLASLLHSFDWKLPEGTELDLSSKYGIVMKKKIPLHLIPTPRLTNLGLYKK